MAAFSDVPMPRAKQGMKPLPICGPGEVWAGWSRRLVAALLRRNRLTRNDFRGPAV